MGECTRNPVGKGVRIDEKAVKEQEYRKTSRLWEKVVRKHSSSVMDGEDNSRRGMAFLSTSPREPSDSVMDSEGTEQTDDASSAAALQKKMMKLKGFPKKSPLRKFDEIVTRELTNRQLADEESIAAFEDSSKWSAMDFSRSKIPGPSRRMPYDTKMSKTTLHNVEKDLKSLDMDPSEVENCALMDAIEKLFQAQASYRFDAAAKAAEAAASSVPIELAEEVAISSTNEYQFQIIDVVNERFEAGDGHKPMEVIGYIGITKDKDTLDDDD